MRKINYTVVIFLALGLAACGGASNEPSSSGGPSSASSAASSASSSASSSTSSSSTSSSSGSVVIGDQFQNVGTHPFVAVAHDPLSTFGVDVDTASYDIFRRDLQGSGNLPQPDSVRVEEYINSFEYQYPAPAADDRPFRISLASAPNILDRTTHILRIGIQAAAPTDRPPANLVFLIDRSRSMEAPNKLPLVKSLLIEALDILDPADTVTVVTYGKTTEVLLPATRVEYKASIADTINQLQTAGSTNGSGGIQLAYQQAKANYIKGGINHVIQCSDGEFNLGLTSVDALIALIKEQRQSGVTFTALGFGSGNLNDAMLEATSNAGNGNYAVISSAEQAVGYARDRLLSNIHYVAKDVKVQVEFNPQLVSHFRQIGYENRGLPDDEFREDEVDAGEIGAGHQVTALYEVVLKTDALPQIDGAPLPRDGADYEGPVAVASDDYVLVKVRYKAVDAVATDPALEVSSSVKILPPEPQEPDPDLRWASAMAVFAEVLKGSPFAEDASLEELGAIFEEQKARDAGRAEFYQLYQQILPKLQAP